MNLNWLSRQWIPYQKKQEPEVQPRKYVSAATAAEITSKSVGVRAKVVESAIAYIDNEIVQEAEKGETSVMICWYPALRALEPLERIAIQQHYKAQGFKLGDLQSMLELYWDSE